MLRGIIPLVVGVGVGVGLAFGLPGLIRAYEQQGTPLPPPVPPPALAAALPAAAFDAGALDAGTLDAGTAPPPATEPLDAGAAESLPLPKNAREEFERRFTNPELRDAMLAYFAGKVPEALAKVQAARQSAKNISDQVLGEALEPQLAKVSELLTRGEQAVLYNAATADTFFTQALEVDERLVMPPRADNLSAEDRQALKLRMKSAVRSRIESTMATHTESQGRVSLKRKDEAAACLMWKVGLRYAPENKKLKQHITTTCVPRALTALKVVRSCDAINGVLDFAPDDQKVVDAAARARKRLCR